jgi:hypothetical protein
MKYADFISLIKLYETSLIKAQVSLNRSAVYRIPEEFGQLLHLVLPILQKNISLFCDPTIECLHIFGIQPTAILPDSVNGKTDFWCNLEFDVILQQQSLAGKNKVLRSDALAINLSTGIIVDNHYFQKLLGLHDDHSSIGKCLGTLEYTQLILCWSKFLRTYFANPNDKVYQETVRNYHNLIVSQFTITGNKESVSSRNSNYVSFFKAMREQTIAYANVAISSRHHTMPPHAKRNHLSSDEIKTGSKRYMTRRAISKSL